MCGRSGCGGVGVGGVCVGGVEEGGKRVREYPGVHVCVHLKNRLAYVVCVIVCVDLTHLQTRALD